MYNDIIIENFSEPKYSGELQNPHWEFEVGNSVCGDRIRIQIEIDNEKIARVVFRAWGCATSVATANIFCSSINDNTIETVINRDRKEISQLLGELEPTQYHCLDILCELHNQLGQSANQENIKLCQIK